MKKIIVVIVLILIIISGVLTLNIINYCILTNNIETIKEKLKQIEEEDSNSRETYNKLEMEYEELKKEKNIEIKEHETWENLLKVIKEKL